MEPLGTQRARAQYWPYWAELGSTEVALGTRRPQAHYWPYWAELGTAVVPLGV